MKQRSDIHQYPAIYLLLPVIIFFCMVTDAAAQTYCLPGKSDCTQKDEILNVKFGTLNNNSVCVADGYADFTSLTAPVLAPGTDVPLSVTINAGGNDNAGAWIDFNKNGIFEAAEYFYIGFNGSSNPLELTKLISIPADAVQGLTRLRIRVRYGNAGISASDFCSTYGYGETEDYTINVTTCKAPSAATTSADTAYCGSGTAVLRVTGGTLADATEWKWYAGSCGGTLAGTGTSITVSPLATTTYFVRGEGGCVVPANCSQVTVTVGSTPGAPIINPVTAFCENIPGLLVINPFTLDLSVPIPDSITIGSGSISIDIPDNTPDGINAEIIIPALPPGAQMTGIDVTLNMTHTYIGDMLFNLKAPNGNIIALVKYLGGTGNPGANFVNTIISSRPTDTATFAYGRAPYSRRFVPDAINDVINGTDVQDPAGYESTAASFTELYGIPAGTWTLAMADGGPEDFGRLTNWSIKVRYNRFNQIPSFPAVWSPAATLFTDAAGTQPYDGATPIFQVYAKPALTTTYTAVSKNGGCESAPASVRVTVNNAAGITAQPVSASVCELGTAIFSAEAKGTTPAYQWLVDTGNGTYTALSDNANYSGTATRSLTVKDVPAAWNNYKYKLLVTSTAPCTITDSSTAAVLTISPTPLVTLSAAPFTKLLPGLSTIITASSAPAAASYSWYRNGTLVPSANSNAFTATVNELGEYKALITDVNGCLGTSDGLTISDSVSGKLFVFPNPSRGQFQVSYHSVANNVLPRALIIYDAKGALVFNKTYSVSKPYDRMEVSLNALAKGVYLINLLDLNGKRLAEGKVVIQ